MWRVHSNYFPSAPAFLKWDTTEIVLDLFNDAYANLLAPPTMA